jgi:hypothetical protein
LNYEYFGTKYGAGICNFMSEQLRMDLLDAALDMVDDVNTTLCMTHVKILKDCGAGRSAFNMLLHYQIEGQIPWGV